MFEPYFSTINLFSKKIGLTATVMAIRICLLPEMTNGGNASLSLASLGYTSDKNFSVQIYEN